MDEREAIQRCLAGDKEAFAVLVRLYQAQILALCLRMTGSREDAADVAQQAFVNCFRHLDRYDPYQPFRPWLYRIATGARRQRWRTRRRWRRRAIRRRAPRPWQIWRRTGKGSGAPWPGTLIGLPLGILTLVAYPVLIYAGQILVAWTAGKFLAERVEGLRDQSWPLLFIVGALATTLLVELPIVGGVISVAAVLYGLGGLYFTLTERRETV